MMARQIRSYGHRRGFWTGIGFLALAASFALASCAPQKVVLEVTDGIEVTLRDERQPPREPPGPGFAENLETRLARSLARVVVRYQKVVVFNDSEPVQLFTEAQRAVIQRVLLRELPKLPADKRLGFALKDVYLANDVDVEIFPEADWLVYDFRSLQRRNTQSGPGVRPINLGTLYPHRDQIAEEGRYPLLKDPITSAAQPDLRPPREDGDDLPESPL